MANSIDIGPDIFKREYERLAKSLHALDLTKVVELHDDTTRQNEPACAGGACEIT